MELSRSGKPTGRGAKGVESGLLVGVLAVAKVEQLLQTDGQLLGEGRLCPLAQIGGDGGVVEGDVLEGFGR